MTALEYPTGANKAKRTIFIMHSQHKPLQRPFCPVPRQVSKISGMNPCVQVLLSLDS